MSAELTIIFVAINLTAAFLIVAESALILYNSPFNWNCTEMIRARELAKRYSLFPELQKEVLDQGEKRCREAQIHLVLIMFLCTIILVAIEHSIVFFL